MAVKGNQIRIISWEEYGRLVRDLSSKIKISMNPEELKSIPYVIGLPRGGFPVMTFLSHSLEIPTMSSLVALKEIFPRIENSPSLLVVDDVVDSGETLINFLYVLSEILGEGKYITACLYYKPWSEKRPDFYADLTEDIIVFPYEKKL